MKIMSGDRAVPDNAFLRLIAFIALLVGVCLCVSPSASAQENATGAADNAYAFTAAYDRRDLDAITALVNSGLDVNARTNEGRTMLTYAAAHADDEAFAVSVAGSLLSKGARVNGEDTFGRAPLVYAIEEDRSALAELLLDNGADVTLQCSAYRMPVVFVPFMRKNAAMAQMVIAKCPDVNIRDSLGNTPLSWATRFGYLDSVRSLLDRGAQIDNLSVHNKTPLMEAAEKGHYDIAALLVSKGANIDIQTNKGWSALMWAAEKGYDNIVSLLIEAGADLFAKNGKGEKARAIARKNNHPETSKLIEKAEFRYWLKKIMIYGAFAAVCIFLIIIAIKYKVGWPGRKP